MILQICNAEPLETTDEQSTSKRSSQSSKDGNAVAQPSTAVPSGDTKNRWTISDVKKKLTGTNKREKYKGLCLKITTSKMRCSIKVKEEFESVDSPLYVKATAFERDILSSSWKSDQFLPLLSIRWNPDNSTIIIPINDESDLEFISVKVTRIKLAI